VPEAPRYVFFTPLHTTLAESGSASRLTQIPFYLTVESSQPIVLPPSHGPRRTLYCSDTIASRYSRFSFFSVIGRAPELEEEESPFVNHLLAPVCSHVL